MPGRKQEGDSRLKSCTSLKQSAKSHSRQEKKRGPTGQGMCIPGKTVTCPQECRAQDTAFTGVIRETTKEHIDIVTVVKFT